MEKLPQQQLIGARAMLYGVEESLKVQYFLVGYSGEKLVLNTWVFL